jgi:hypothetical protein
MRTRRPWRLHLSLLLSLLGLGCGENARDVRVLEWVRAKGLAAGSTHDLSLPEDLAAASADARVHVARLADGRTCILLKKSIGWKNNFDGVLQCDAPLRPSEVVAAPPVPRAYVTLPGHALFEELYVRSRRDERGFNVYFDLN